MNEVVEHLEKESRNYIGQAISEIEPENVDAAFEAMQTDMMVGAQIVILKLIEKSKAEEMNHWEMQQELEDIRHHLQMHISPPPPVAKETDEFLNKVIVRFTPYGKITRTEIQLQFKIGYFQAGRVLEQLAEKGIIDKGDFDNPDAVFVLREGKKI